MWVAQLDEPMAFRAPARRSGAAGRRRGRPRPAVRRRARGDRWRSDPGPLRRRCRLGVPWWSDVDALIAVVDDDFGRTCVAGRGQLGLGLAAVLRERLVIAFALHEPRSQPVGEDMQGRIRGHRETVATKQLRSSGIGRTQMRVSTLRERRSLGSRRVRTDLARPHARQRTDRRCRPGGPRSRADARARRSRRPVRIAADTGRPGAPPRAHTSAIFPASTRDGSHSAGPACRDAALAAAATATCRYTGDACVRCCRRRRRRRLTSWPVTDAGRAQ